MSIELHVLLQSSRLPDPSQWQAEIDRLGFDVKLDPDFTAATHSGYLPVMLNGSDSGFEFDVGPASEIAETYPDFVRLSDGQDCSANFSWGGDLDEMACAMVASAALARLCDGVWFDPQEGKCHDADGAIEAARAAIEDAD